ncbi:Uncharacterised protein [Mycobacteroides abscessus subsp. abscessus]|nr:Uncharacterised protein [Mycobacteroides abscessus subsp. abscessus]
MPTTKGRLANPARNADQPQAYWYSWVETNMTPTIAIITEVCRIAEPRTVRRPSSLRSSIGSVAVRSRRRKPSRQARPPTRISSVQASDQPHSVPAVKV